MVSLAGNFLFKSENTQFGLGEVEHKLQHYKTRDHRPRAESSPTNTQCHDSETEVKRLWCGRNKNVDAMITCSCNEREEKREWKAIWTELTFAVFVWTFVGRSLFIQPTTTHEHLADIFVIGLHLPVQGRKVFADMPVLTKNDWVIETLFVLFRKVQFRVKSADGWYRPHITGWANADVPSGHSAQTPLIVLLDVDPHGVVIL